MREIVKKAAGRALGTLYINPPYGRDRGRRTTIYDWLHKAAKTHHECGAEILALVPVATNTRHWKCCVFGVATAIAFLYDTRLKFMVDGKPGGKGAPMACAMIYWGRRYERFETVFAAFGAVCDIRHLIGKPIGESNQLALWRYRV